jgi:hypothetical protein
LLLKIKAFKSFAFEELCGCVHEVSPSFFRRKKEVEDFVFLFPSEKGNEVKCNTPQPQSFQKLKKLCFFSF